MLSRVQIPMGRVCEVCITAISHGNYSSIMTLSDTMLHALCKFVSIPSVSNSPQNREDCRQAAIWLKKCLIQLGAEGTLVSPHITSIICEHSSRRPSFQHQRIRIPSFSLLSMALRLKRFDHEFYSMDTMML